ncbi:MAG: 4-hydroxythreonine-4-phosphate dehydrogenase PdxA [Methylophilaceae bacterium]
MTTQIEFLLPKIAITAGEPAGIGLDLCAMLAQQALDAKIIVIADQYALQQRAQALNLPLNICADEVPHLGNGGLQVMHHALAEPAVAGVLNKNNSAYVLNTLTTAALGCQNGTFDAMVTAPVHKGIINDAGINFTGHTEFLAELTHTPQVVMMLAGGGMRVALATTHLALKEVPAAITQANIESTLRILHADLKQKFGIAQPKIFVAGLNPHAGEGGYLGMEEIEIINPVLEKCRAQGMDLIGALPADTMFSPKNLKVADAFFCMFHDQGLPVLKHASFGTGVNVTLGLPIIRTSVDHGTALDLAGTGKAEIGSLLAAINLAIALANKNKNT